MNYDKSSSNQQLLVNIILVLLAWLANCLSKS